MEYLTEAISCPCCHVQERHTVWARENGYTAVKCLECGLVYVNPRPCSSMIDDAVKTGVHRELDHGRTAIVRRSGRNIKIYRKHLAAMFRDMWASGGPISWLDVGAGYGEFLEAVTSLAPAGSRIRGIEPMKPKADACRQRGLAIEEAYLTDVNEEYDVVSLMNVFSHIPNFYEFLENVKRVLRNGGEFFIETGNIGDLESVRDVPTELDLPDHLVFAGEENMRTFLRSAGFAVIDIRRRRKDTVENALKNCVKKMLGRQVTLALPYSSPYRSLLIRARLESR
ncbi:MAG: class I SAM-dependent methyltransferase [Myxococcota bacterium]|nr:class I SAM-dependent methyltransferase [Myxococcota bacterium]